jgi:large exoprotein involved in heme utilization and adhesion
VNAANTVLLTNSQINASVQGASETIGGNIVIDPQYVILLNSQILTQATQGQGGNIFITTSLLLPDANSIISASSQFGQNGTITIQSPIAPASGKIIPLPQKPLIATTLLSQRCAALAGGTFSSFTVAGRDSLPAEPGSWLSNPLALTTLSGGTGLAANGEAEGVVQGERREAGGEGERQRDEREMHEWRERQEAGGEGETPILSLRQIAPPGFLTQAFAVDGSAGCTS